MPTAEEVDVQEEAPKKKKKKAAAAEVCALFIDMFASCGWL